MTGSEDIASADALAEHKDSPLPAPQTLPVPAFTPVPREKDRSNGWKPHIQQAFIEALAETGSVRAACRRVGRSDHGAYQLRRHPEAASFRAAWDAAIDLGVRRIEDGAMDRALYGTEETVHYHGEHVATRRRYNERLVMFILRNRAPERYGDGTSPAQKGAIGKMEKKRLKKKWRAKWRKQWEEEQPGHRMEKAAEARTLIEHKLDDLRSRVNARRAAEWRALSPETRAAYRHYEELRARDLGRAFAMPDHLASEEEIAEQARAWAAECAARRPSQEEVRQAILALPPADEDEPEAEESEPERGVRVRTLKDEGWE